MKRTLFYCGTFYLEEFALQLHWKKISHLQRLLFLLKYIWDFYSILCFLYLLFTQDIHIHVQFKCFFVLNRGHTTTIMVLFGDIREEPIIFVYIWGLTGITFVWRKYIKCDWEEEREEGDDCVLYWSVIER
jgi:hypothetical protein